MMAINHAVTGAIIGAAVPVPEIAMPVAYLSHYALDMIPHFGLNGIPNHLTTKLFRNILLVDAAACVLFAGVIALAHPMHWWLIIVCAFLGTSPDLFWINRFRYERAGKGSRWKANWHSKFASKIQWFEKPIGGVVEAAWLAGAVIILTGLLTA